MENRFIINVFLLCIALFLVTGLVIGFGGTTPSTMGHSAGEIEGVLKTDVACTGNQVLKGFDISGTPICEIPDGTIVGGGVEIYPDINGVWSCKSPQGGTSWGSAICDETSKDSHGNFLVKCPSLSIKKQIEFSSTIKGTYYDPDDHTAKNVIESSRSYICIQNARVTLGTND